MMGAAANQTRLDAGRHIFTRVLTNGEHEDRHEAPAHALTDAAERADLVVVGSRGLHGLRALGSVSERVAHDAACSVLVARIAPPSQERSC